MGDVGADFARLWPAIRQWLIDTMGLEDESGDGGEPAPVKDDQSPRHAG
jgi:hypothetical protein